MTGPTRLRDDPKASISLRLDLERASGADRPELDLVTGLAALEAAMAAPAGAAPLEHVNPANGATGGAGSAIAPTLAGAIAKGVLAGLLAIGAVTAGSALIGDDAKKGSLDDHVNNVPAVVSAHSEEPAPLETSLPLSVTPPPVAPAHSAHASPRTTASTLSATSASTADPVAPNEELSPLARETKQVIDIRSLAGADPARALALAEASQREFPGGAFSEEREALIISSMARVGRTVEARARADRFFASHPASPYAARIHTLLGY